MSAVNWEELCRLCATNSDLNEEVINSSSEISQIILKYLSISITSDERFSSKICRKCEDKVTEFHHFASECERIQAMFEAYKSSLMIPFPAIKTECDSEIHIKEEFKCDYDPIDYLEECHDFAEPIENSKEIEELIESKKRKTRLKKNEFDCFVFSCHICNQECKNWNALALHSKDVHDKEPQIRCVCLKMLYNYRSVLRHKKKHDPRKCFTCGTCSKTFPSKRELEVHVNTHLPKTNFPYVCCKCAKKFSNPKCLAVHEKIHIPRAERLIWACEVCDKRLASKGALIAHVRNIHEKLRPHMCDLCGHSFTSRANLKNHSTIHSNERNYKCEKCEKRFKTKTNLQRHFDTHADTAYQCPHCPMLLNSRKTLRNHLYVHDECSNHMCSVCGRGFKRKKDLKSHMKLHTGERPYKCTWCPRTFSSKSNSRIHKKRMHPNEFRIEEKNNPFAPVADRKKNVPKKIIHTTIKAHPIPLKPLGTNESNKINDESKKGTTKTC